MKNISSLYFFDDATSFAIFMTRFLRSLGLLSAAIEKVANNISEVKNIDGETLFHQYRRDARKIARIIRREKINRSPLITVLRSEWQPEKIQHHFERNSEKEISLECFRIALTKWMLTQKPNLSGKPSCLVIARQRWFFQKHLYAMKHGIELFGYRTYWSSLFMSIGINSVKLFKKALSQEDHTETSYRSNQFEWDNDANRKNDIRHMSDLHRHTIAVSYSGGKLSLDASERSDLFWLIGSGIPYSNVLIYNFNGYITSKLIKQFSEKTKIKIIGNGNGAVPWKSTSLALRMFLHKLKHITQATVKCLQEGKWVSPDDIIGLIFLAKEYAYWYDFYYHHQVRINIGTLVNSNVAQVLALDQISALSIVYQHSLSNTYPVSFLSAGENVQFVFSEEFKRLWRSIDAPVDRIVQTGFIYDSVVCNVNRSDRIRETREQLQKNGVKFTICFFDENSIDRWDIPASHEKAVRDYEFLLNWLFDDLSLGLIFKPKRSNSLFDRISRISGMIQRANATGRCMFLMSDTPVGSIYPGEAALMSDFCVGKLSGSTAAMEARMTGIPTLLIDDEAIYWHPFYRWGANHVVFDNWMSLRKAVELYRAVPSVHPELGDWSAGWQGLDSFRDGQSRTRMGSFIRWIFEALQENFSPQAAIQIAESKFKKRWGINTVTRYSRNGRIDSQA